ncbi:MAG: DUF4267 domain-containing protein [Terriglobia bacterium]
MAIVAVFGLSLCVIGGFALAVPLGAARMYGIAISEASTRAYVIAAGLRDLAIGAWLLGLMALRVSPRVLGLSIAVLTLIPIGDAIIVWHISGTSSPLAIGLHLSSAVVLVVLAWRLWYDSD